MDLKMMWATVQNRYPMMMMAMDRYGHRTINAQTASKFSDYINMVDAHHIALVHTAADQLICA
jgi:hypothetical protein